MILDLHNWSRKRTYLCLQSNGKYYQPWQQWINTRGDRRWEDEVSSWKAICFMKNNIQSSVLKHFTSQHTKKIRVLKPPIARYNPSVDSGYSRPDVQVHDLMGSISQPICQSWRHTGWKVLLKIIDVTKRGIWNNCIFPKWDPHGTVIWSSPSSIITANKTLAKKKSSICILYK